MRGGARAERLNLPEQSPRAGFPPVARADAHILILGSLPGEESLRQGQYYGHKANRFWWIMGELVGAFPDLPYEVRLERLRAHRIVLWDVCATAIRPGSLDHRIDVSSVVANDFARFFAAHPALRRLCFNGRHAAELFRRKVKTKLPPGMECRQLPSTSPAHAAMPPAEKLALWREALSKP